MRGGRDDSEDGGAGAEQEVPAVAYVRMSTDHQKYSTENQLDVIRSYAAARGLQILHVFEDSGRYGLRLDGREALQNLMAEVQSGHADFKAILVYDVSRVQRMYEMFVNDGRPEREIAEVLNAEGNRTDLDRPWKRATVHQVLTNEKYIGNNVFAKVSFKLKQRRVVNPREMSRPFTHARDDY